MLYIITILLCVLALVIGAVVTGGGLGAGSLETLFKKRYWIVVLVLITMNTLIAATAISGVFDIILAPFTVVVPQHTQPEPAPAADPNQDEDALAIGELLEPQATGEPEPDPEPDPEPEPEPDPEPEPVAFPGECVQSSLPAKLVGTMTDEDGNWSMALVQDQTRSRTLLVSEGDEVAGAIVLRVERSKMWVDRSGDEECLNAGVDPAAASATPEPTASASNRSSRRSRNSDSGSRSSARASDPTPQTPEPTRSATTDFESSINRVSSTQYEIQRSAINEAMDNPRQLQASAPEFRQAFDNGQPNGIQITSMPRGSIFSRLGIRRGDILMEVNSRPITTPQRAMDLYEALQSDSHVELVVQRRGRQRTISYDIR